jgi:hypothetical protein
MGQRTYLLEARMFSGPFFARDKATCMKGPMRVWIWLFAVSILLAPIVAWAQAPRPATSAAVVAVDTGIVSYTDKSDDTMLTVGVASDPKVKAAALSIQAVPSSQYDADWTPLTVFFSSAADWRDFMALWAKAVQVKPGSDSIDVGQYMDDNTKVMLTISRDSDGSIGFAAYNGHHPFLLNIESSQFKLFEAELKKVSAYFAKR